MGVSHYRPSLVLTRLHTRYFPTSCLLAPLVSRLTLTQPKSSSWHLLIVITASPLTGPLPLKIKMDYHALMAFSDWEGIFNCIGIPGAVHWKES